MIDFLNKYSMSYKTWKKYMSEWVESAMDSANPVEDFKDYVKGHYYDCRSNEPLGDKRDKDYKKWKKSYDTWNQVLGIAEGCDTRHPTDVLEDMLYEIETLYQNNRWDKEILLHDVVYMLAVYLERAKQLD